MKQTRMILLAVVLISVVSTCSRENNGDSNTAAEEKNEQKFDTRAEEKEANFVAGAIEEKYADIKLAELASTKSSNKEVQDVAQQLVKDQSESLAVLQNLANKKGIVFPGEEGDETSEDVNELSKQQDADFDKKWCDQIIARHKKTIREFELMRDKSEDPELKEIIMNDLKGLRAHLDRLNSIEENIM
jgi:putative membrane protein